MPAGEMLPDHSRRVRRFLQVGAGLILTAEIFGEINGSVCKSQFFSAYLISEWGGWMGKVAQAARWG